MQFRLGDIEDMPLKDNIAEVVVSNCVLNLVPNKTAVFTEILRILKPEGHFSISDVVLEGDLPEKLKSLAEMYAGCVSGAIPENEYMGIIKQVGFQNIAIQKRKAIIIPDDILRNYLSAEEIENLRKSDVGIFSITVYAEKPLLTKATCCPPNAGCC